MRIIATEPVDNGPTYPATHEGWAGWSIDHMTGFRISHPYIAVAPGCPNGPHPTRDCGCHVFRTPSEAATYITEQLAQAAS